MRSKILFSPISLLIATGCTLAPKYTRPQRPVPEAFPVIKTQGSAPLAAETTWQDYFTDAKLQKLIEMALENNLDLRVASLNVDKVRALYRIQRSELIPGFGVMGGGQKTRISEKMSDKGEVRYQEQYTVQVGLMSWELDFFGRLQSLKNRALNQYLATQEGERAARISLVGGVAQSYFATAASRENLRLAESTFEAQKSFFDLISKSRELGVASDLDLNQAKSQMESARADVAHFKGLVATSQSALDLLLGVPVPQDLLPEGLDAAGQLKDLSAGLSSETLLARPDIQAAEYQLQGATANIGAARAAFFPRISLTAGLGNMSPDLSSLFESGTRTWTFAPQIIAPLFAGGSLWSNLKVSKVDREIAVAQYQKAIQVAFKEVSDGLIKRESLNEQLEAQKALVESLENTYKLSELRYKEGLDGYLGVLISQRSLYGAQQGLVATRLACQANQIALFKALGGKM